MGRATVRFLSRTGVEEERSVIEVESVYGVWEEG